MITRDEQELWKRLCRIRRGTIKEDRAHSVCHRDCVFTKFTWTLSDSEQVAENVHHRIKILCQSYIQNIESSQYDFPFNA